MIAMINAAIFVYLQGCTISEPCTQVWQLQLSVAFFAIAPMLFHAVWHLQPQGAICERSEQEQHLNEQEQVSSCF